MCLFFFENMPNRCQTARRAEGIRSYKIQITAPHTCFLPPALGRPDRGRAATASAIKARQAAGRPPPTCYRKCLAGRRPEPAGNQTDGITAYTKVPTLPLPRSPPCTTLLRSREPQMPAFEQDLTTGSCRFAIFRTPVNKRVNTSDCYQDVSAPGSGPALPGAKRHVRRTARYPLLPASVPRQPM